MKPGHFRAAEDRTCDTKQGRYIVKIPFVANYDAKVEIANAAAGILHCSCPPACDIKGDPASTLGNCTKVSSVAAAC